MRAVATIALALALGCVPCVGCEEEEELGCPGSPEGASIIALGDSVMAWLCGEEASIPDVIGRELERKVFNAAVSGAYFTDELSGETGMDIREQYIEQAWDWLVIDGGANDLNEECGCDACDGELDAIITADGSAGALPELVSAAVGQGVRVVILGYYNVPDTAEYGFADCNDLIDEYSARQELLAAAEPDVWYVDGREAFSPSDLDAYDDDHAHPSALGAQLIGEAIAAQILAAEAGDS